MALKIITLADLLSVVWCGGKWENEEMRSVGKWGNGEMPCTGRMLLMRHDIGWDCSDWIAVATSYYKRPKVEWGQVIRPTPATWQ